MVTVEFLRDRLTYEKETGRLWWKPRPDTNKGNRVFNKRFAGTEAFTFTNKDGYKCGCINGFGVIRSHRVIWAIVYGEFPEFIDHINGDRSDNRICNLRSVTKQENAMNQKRRSDNTSGATGVTLHGSTGKWRARIQVGDARNDIGLFGTVEEAMLARRQAETDLAYGPNHGR